MIILVTYHKLEKKCFVVPVKIGINPIKNIGFSDPFATWSDEQKEGKLVGKSWCLRLEQRGLIQSMFAFLIFPNVLQLSVLRNKMIPLWNLSPAYSLSTLLVYYLCFLQKLASSPAPYATPRNCLKLLHLLCLPAYFFLLWLCQ